MNLVESVKNNKEILSTSLILIVLSIYWSFNYINKGHIQIWGFVHKEEKAIVILTALLVSTIICSIYTIKQVLKHGK